MNTFFKLVASAFIAVIAAPSLTAQTVKVGTFDKASVVVAFYRSPQWADVLNKKQIERQQAKQSNDQKKIEELDHWGESAQELAHKQLAGEAPIANVLDTLQPLFPEIAAKARVAIIVPDLVYADSTVERVDITDLLLDQLKADRKTRQIVEEMRTSKKPVTSH